METSIQQTFGYVAAGAASLVGGIVGAYLSQRGKNLATKADVGEITQRIESVKSTFAKELEDRKATHQLRTACMDHRLAAHQQAYSLWLKLVQNVHGPDNGDVVRECQDWWNANCLYLEQDAREMFVMAFRAAHQHPDILSRRRIEQGHRDEVEANWEQLVAAGPAIEKAAGLPAIQDLITVTPDNAARPEKMPQKQKATRSP